MSDLPVSALDFVMKREGVDFGAPDPLARIGYVNDPLDPGGATAFGVTQRVYDAWRTQRGLPPRSVRLIEYATEVRPIYNENYWHDAMCHAFNDAKPRLALVVFDWAVNGGVARARRYLQAAVGVPVDGIVGPHTLAAIAACEEGEAVQRYLILRAAHYHLRADDGRADRSRHVLDDAGLGAVAPSSNPSQQKFLPGWLARLRWNARECGVLFDSSYAKE